MQYLVYKIINDFNNKIYIGQTTETLEKRFARHCGYQLNDDTYFHRVIKKYGVEHFYIELICQCNSQEELDKKEYEYITSYPREQLYNTKFVQGKCGGDTLSMHPDKKEISKKISNSKMGAKNPRAKAVRATNIKTGECFEFGSALECVRIIINCNSKDHSPVTRRCRGIIKCPLHGEWIFEYISNKSVSTNPDECKGVGSEISTDSKQETIV